MAGATAEDDRQKVVKKNRLRHPVGLHSIGVARQKISGECEQRRELIRIDPACGEWDGLNRGDQALAEPSRTPRVRRWGSNAVRTCPPGLLLQSA